MLGCRFKKRSELGSRVMTLSVGQARSMMMMGASARWGCADTAAGASSSSCTTGNSSSSTAAGRWCGHIIGGWVGHCLHAGQHSTVGQHSVV